MLFTLHRRPGGVIFLDDDRDYVETLREVLPPDWHVELFVRPVACIERLQQDTRLREADAWAQQGIVNRWREGALLVPDILRYWREDGMARFALTQVAVVDYAMPAMSGLRVLGELTRWPGVRVLLTGRVDEQLAISAFNRGLINRFIPKQSPDIRQRLVGTIEALREQPDRRHQQIWCATLTPGQHALLQDPAMAQALDALLREQGWTEHIAIGAPFGVLALNPAGQASWLQLEPADKLPELAEMAQAEGWDACTVQAIGSGRQLLDLTLALALGEGHSAAPREAFVLAGEAGCLHGAIVPIGEAFSPGLAVSHQRFLAEPDNRRLPQD